MDYLNIKQEFSIMAIMSTRELIDSFLAKKRVALVGVSSNENDFSRVLMNDLIKRGYDLVPVNPNATRIDGIESFASVRDIQPQVEAALIMTNPEIACDIIHDCISAGISLAWLYKLIGRGSVSREALELCEQKNIQVIPGYCPYMFLPDSGLIHRIHGFFMKLSGSYPK